MNQEEMSRFQISAPFPLARQLDAHLPHAPSVPLPPRCPDFPFVTEQRRQEKPGKALIFLRALPAT